MVPRLLSRDGFREGVFARDKGRCVLCGAEAQDAHHVIERKLWEDGGYYLDNGASVCGLCHERCEMTLVSVEEVRKAAGIKTFLVPPGFDVGDPIDKWGNSILPNGQRMRGPLFDDTGCQAMLVRGGCLGLFTSWVKYPRTRHLPWSEGRSDDDIEVTDLSVLSMGPIVVTEKLDGENTTLYRDGLHARSLNTKGGPERDWIKSLQAEIAHDIPEGWRVCGENLWATHSIFYRKLPSYFQVFGIWNEKNVCLPWRETVEWCALLGLVTVTVLYEGAWDEKLLRKLHQATRDGEECEGYVVRSAAGFRFGDFGRSVVKYVRAQHVKTDQHWKHGPLTKNGLKGRLEG